MTEDKPEVGVIAFFACGIAVTIFVAVLALMTLRSSDFAPGILIWAIFWAIYGWMIGIFIAMFTALPIGCLIGWLFNRTGNLNEFTAALTGGFTAILLAGAVTFGEWTSGNALGAIAFALLGSGSGWGAYRLTVGRPIETTES